MCIQVCHLLLAAGQWSTWIGNPVHWLPRGVNCAWLTRGDSTKCRYMYLKYFQSFRKYCCVFLYQAPPSSNILKFLSLQILADKCMHVSFRLNFRFERKVGDEGAWYISACTIFKLYKVVKYIPVISLSEKIVST